MREWKRREATGIEGVTLLDLAGVLKAVGSVERFARAEATDQTERRFHDMYS
jgi:hypothetical protein